MDRGAVDMGYRLGIRSSGCGLGLSVVNWEWRRLFWGFGVWGSGLGSGSRERRKEIGDVIFFCVLFAQGREGYL